MSRAAYACGLSALLMTAVVRADDANAVRVTYAKGTPGVATFKQGVKPYSNRDYVVKSMPAELNGLSFARHNSLANEPIAFDAPAGATVYLLMGRSSASTDLRKDLAGEGWELLKQPVEMEGAPKGHGTLSAYRKTFGSATTVLKPAVQSAGGGVVLAKRLEVVSGDTSEPSPAAATAEPAETSAMPAAQSGPTTRCAKQQATIRALEIYQTDSGMMLGQTSEATLTVTPGPKRGLAVVFATHVGKEMMLARDEMLRYVRLQYPNWFAEHAELTFEDKYVGHDGGSIGAALGTLVLSVVDGFTIDPAAAMTGDISANGKVRAIGGVGAKLKGAIASKCTITAVPQDNYDQLVDAVVYNGPSLLMDTQVIGMATLTDAVAAVRTDRADRLARAVAKFADLQQAAAGKPAYLRTKPGLDALAEVLELAPEHYSAKILQQYGQAKLPRTLSATASMYYTTLAAKPVLGILAARSGNTAAASVPSASVRAGLADLRKLRPLADENVRPQIDAWMKLIDAITAYQTHQAPAAAVDRQRQVLLDELSREQADTDMMQKMLKEGI